MEEIFPFDPSRTNQAEHILTHSLARSYVENLLHATTISSYPLRIQTGKLCRNFFEYVNLIKVFLHRECKGPKNIHVITFFLDSVK